MKGLEHHFVALVKERLLALDTNAFAVEKSAGLPPDAIRNVIRSEKKSGPTLSRVDEICQALDLEIYIGPRRDEENLPVLRGRSPDTVIATPDRSKPGAGDILVDGVEYERVRRFDVDASAGFGASLCEDQSVDSMLITLNMLKRLGISAEASGIINVRGDSMSPTVPDRSKVLVDFTDREIRRDGEIYVVLLDDETYIKRLSRVDLDGSRAILMSSDNPTYPVTVVSSKSSNQFKVVGRVRSVISEV